MFKPSEIIQNSYTLTCAGVDMAKAIQKFEKDNKHQLEMGKFKVEGKSVKLLLEGELTTNGMAENKWTNSVTNKSTTTLSLGIALDEEDLQFFEAAADALAIFVGDDYELTSLVKNDIIYLKAKDKKVFNAMSNTKSDTLFHGQKVSVVVEFKYYINLKDEKAGIVLHPVKYNFIQEEA